MACSLRPELFYQLTVFDFGNFGFLQLSVSCLITTPTSAFITVIATPTPSPLLPFMSWSWWLWSLKKMVMFVELLVTSVTPTLPIPLHIGWRPEDGPKEKLAEVWTGERMWSGEEV